MGFSGISPMSLILILVIIVLLFGTKRLRNIGSDLGEAMKNFKRSFKDNSQEENKDASKIDTQAQGGNVIDAQVTNKDKDKV